MTCKTTIITGIPYLIRYYTW